MQSVAFVHMRRQRPIAQILGAVQSLFRLHANVVAMAFPASLELHAGAATATTAVRKRRRNAARCH
jgi:hypothetical protein